MIISPPFLPASGLSSSNASKPDPMMDMVDQFEIGHHGAWPVTFDRRSHCAIHLNPGEQAEPVRAIADGDVVAYRVCKNAISDGTTDSTTGQPVLNSNAGFVLLRHKTDTGVGRTITYYSLYMHLLDMTSQEHIVPQPNDPPETGSTNALPKWLLDTAGGKDGVVQTGGTKKVYRKDMLGYVGQHQGVAHLHFEIFMTDADFTAWFDQDGHKVQIGEKNPVQPQSGDYWGHSYFVIKGPLDLYPQPAGMNDTWFPRVPGGAIAAGDTLYVEAWFSKGQRFTRAWIGRGNTGNVTLLTSDPVADPYDSGTDSHHNPKRYEYDLYGRAMALSTYAACPSDGYEMLRFGRILSDHPTLTASACATWIAVPFDENGTLGYVNIAPDAITKLSDADFPFFTGWQKVDADNTPFNDAGRCDYATLCGLTGIQDSLPSAQPLEADPNNNDEVNLQLASYVQNTNGVNEKLRGMVFKARSEWDPSNNEERYKDLNDPYGFFGKQKDTNPDGYTRFTNFLSKFQFLDKTPLAGQELWFFHPLAFIRHFRKCGWLSPKEYTLMFPPTALRSVERGQWVSERISPSRDTIAGYGAELNKAMCKFGIARPLRQAAFLGNAMQETQWFSLLTERGSTPPPRYAPWIGRGFLQLTWPDNYIKYWRFCGRQVDQSLADRLHEAAHTTNTTRNNHALMAVEPVVPVSMQEWRRLLSIDKFDATDSAAAYWAWSGAAKYADMQPVLRRETKPVGMSPMAYFSCESFGQVAATVNVGHPSSSFSSINGLQARFQGYTSALMALTDWTELRTGTGF
ncbi:hypothetical protein [Paraburkholderia silvatlantica]|nr:hypothetical protein [Paraburkholderia silvatlantica]